MEGASHNQHAEHVMQHYKKTQGQDFEKYLIPAERKPQKQVKHLIKSLSDAMHPMMNRMIGYQANHEFDYRDTISMFLDMTANNVGDPFQRGRYTINSKEMEYAVIRYYAQLWNLPLRDISIDTDLSPTKGQDPDAYWGYVLSMGSSEGNIMAFWMARDYIAGKYLIIDEEEERIVTRMSKMDHQEQGKKVLNKTVYFTSDAAHYSVIKSAVLMNVMSFAEYGNLHYLDEEIPGVKVKGKQFPLMVPTYSDIDGRADINKLVALVKFFAKRKHGIIVVLNYGTTFTGGFDDVQTACVRLRKVFQETGLDKINHKVHSKGKTIEESRTGYWIHVDGAYGGSYLPYLDRHFERKKTDIHSVVDRVRDEKGNIAEYTIESIPDIDFIKYPELCSVVTSGHKCPGAPWPSGVFMTKHKYQLYPPSSPMYIGSMDSTLSGSRNALSPIILWEYLSTKTDIDLENDSFRCFELARELEEKLRHIANEKNKKYPTLNLEVYRAPFSLSLILSRLKRSLIQRYTLADQDLYSADGLSKRSFNHMYVMEHMIANRKLVDDFLHDVAQEHSFEDELIPLAPELFPHLSEDIEYRAKRKKLFKFGHGK